MQVVLQTNTPDIGGGGVGGGEYAGMLGDAPAGVPAAAVVDDADSASTNVPPPGGGAVGEYMHVAGATDTAFAI
jgi:hypothetical protein